MNLKEGQVINGRYQLVMRLGKGGFASVWLARDQKLDNIKIAIKFYVVDGGLDPEGVELFKQEYLRTRNLQHSHLLTPFLFDTIEDTNIPFLVMTYCEGGSLGRELSAGDRFSEDKIALLLVDIALGLAHLHEKGIIHRDLKPDNILIGDDGKYLLCDFGISTRLHHTLTRATSKRDATSSGTPAFMAPELFSKSPEPLLATDIFSLGVMLVELSRGSLPEIWDRLGAGLVLKQGGEVPELPHEYSNSFVKLLTMCLAINPERRPDAQDVYLAAKGFVESGRWDIDHLPLLSEQQSSSSRQTQYVHQESNKGSDISEQARRQTFEQQQLKNKKNKGFAPILVTCILIAAAALIWWVLNPGENSPNSNQIGTSTTAVEDSTSNQQMEPTDVNRTSTDSIIVETSNPKTSPATSNKPGNRLTDTPVATVPASSRPATDLAAAKSLFEQGMDMYLKGNFESSFKLFEQASEKGSSEALTLMGWMYSHEQGVVEDHDAAVRSYLEAIKKGDVKANFFLGHAYYDGEGVEESKTKATELYNRGLAEVDKAANSGSVFWLMRIGYYYRGKYSGEAQPEKGFQYLIKAAKKGHADAQNVVGISYRDGQGVERDFIEAKSWLEKSANQGSPYGQTNLGEMYYYGQGMDPDDEVAYGLFKKAAEQGHTFANGYLGEMYDNGYFVAADWEQAFKNYKIHNDGNVRQTKWIRVLGEFYLFGVGGAPKDKAKAIDYFKKSNDALSKIYLEVLPKIGSQSKYAGTNSAGDKLEVSATNDEPFVMSQLGSSWVEEATLTFGQSSSARVWPSYSALSQEPADQPKDQIKFTSYSASEKFTENASKEVSFSSKKPRRTIGYMYVCATFSENTIVVKVPMALTWAPD